MSQLDKRLLNECKEAIYDVESKKFPKLFYPFRQRLDKARESDDKELEEWMKLLSGIFSMYFQFAKGQPFGPLMAGPQGRSMIPEDLTESELCKIEEVLQVSNNSTFIARICDVLWIRRRDYLYAQKAINAYLQSVDEDKNNKSWVSKSEWLKRAAQIAMELGEKVSERQLVKEKLMNLFEESRKRCFNSGQGFWPHALLEIIVSNKFADNWEELGDKVVEIAKGFPVSPGCEEPRKYYSLAIECYNYAKKPNKVNAAKLSIAKHWEDEANSFKTPQGCDGFNLAYRLEKAVHVYRDVGEKGKAEELIREWKEANKTAISQMKPISVEIETTSLVKIADDFLEGKNGKDAITAFISLYTPCCYEKEKELVNDLNRKHPVLAMFGKSTFTAEGNISEKISSMLDDKDERVKADIISQYNLSQELTASTTLKRGLYIILNSDGTWKDAIKELLNSGKFVPKDRIDIYEKAIISGFEGDMLVFSHLIIPQLENSVRSIFAENKLNITSVYQSGVQREKDLNDLLKDENAEKIFGKDLLWEMRSLLIAQSGPNLRNRICHGLMNPSEIDSPSLVFLIWLTLYLLFGFQRDKAER